MSGVLSRSGEPRTGRTPAARDRRSLDPIDRLSRELDDVCTTAVDALEIAAILEAGGTTDSVSRDVYNCANVFELAEQLYQRTPSVTADASAELHADRPAALRDLSHGLVFTLNGVLFSIVMQVATTPQAIGALVVALVISWSYGQASSLLWHQVSVRDVPGAGQTLLRRTLMVAMAGGLVAGFIADRFALDPVVILLAIGQVIFVVAAAVLLLYRREAQFIASLAPAALAAGAHLAAWPAKVETTTVLALVVASMIAVVVQAAWIVRPQGEAPHRTDVRRTDLGGAAQIACYGVVAASLLSYNALTTLVGAKHDMIGFDASVLPLVLTIGVAEWQLRSYRRLTRHVMSGTYDLAQFGAVTWRFLLRCFARYWSVLILTSLVVWMVVWTRQDAVPVENTLLTIAFTILGGAFFLNLLLISCGRMDIAVRSFAVAGVLYAGLVAVPIENPTTRAGLYLALCCGLLTLLLVTARRVVRRTLAHL